MQHDHRVVTEHVVTIRGESHRVQQALVRSATHVAYHVGQILYLARWLRPAGEWLTIAPGSSQAARGAYLKQPPDRHGA